MYWPIFLGKVFAKTMRGSSYSHSLLRIQEGKCALRDVREPQIGDAMDLFYHCWSKTKIRTIIKCWMKIKCLFLSESPTRPGNVSLLLQ